MSKKQSDELLIFSLNRKQWDFLKLVDSEIKKRGYPPSIAELSETMHVSITAIVQRIETLIRKDYLVRTRGIARSLTVTPEGKEMIERGNRTIKE